MKHLMTLMALVVAVTAGAQGTTIHEYPWNPDFNNDTYIGSEDLMGLLSTYGTQFGNPPEPCDYDGSSFEDLFAGAWNGEIIIDSIFIEYELENIVSYFEPGCPDPIVDTVIFANSFTTGQGNLGMIGTIYALNFIGNDAFGGIGVMNWEFSGTSGLYRIRFWIQTHGTLGFNNDGIYGSDSDPWSQYTGLPFPAGWYSDEEGIHLEVGWDSNDWPYYANYLHILPYWHYAE